MKTPHLSLILLSIVSGFALSGSLAAQDVPAATAPQPSYGDQSSQTLTTKAWEALTAKNYAFVDAYTARCVELYAAQAKEMQASLPARAPAETASSYWALNDVGTCLYVRGQALEAQGKTKEAIAAYRQLVSEFSYAQTWDTKGWFWPPADAAKQRIQVLEFETL